MLQQDFQSLLCTRLLILTQRQQTIGIQQQRRGGLRPSRRLYQRLGLRSIRDAEQSDGSISRWLERLLNGGRQMHSTPDKQDDRRRNGPQVRFR